jgi:hypothetical protein
MGATTFGTIGNLPDAKEAFDLVVNEARHKYGHGGYTGSIAEKQSFVIVDRTEHSRADAGDVAEQLIDMGDSRIDDKWGPAGAIRVKDRDIDGWYFFGWASE